MKFNVSTTYPKMFLQMYKTYPIIYPERLQGALQSEPNPYIQHPILLPPPQKNKP